jgi:hypothetical protein
LIAYVSMSHGTNNFERKKVIKPTLVRQWNLEFQKLFLSLFIYKLLNSKVRNEHKQDNKPLDELKSLFGH